MIGEDVFAVEPWAVRERELHLDLLAQTESILALSNGHIGLRANLDEGEPAGTPGHVPERVLRDPPAAPRRGRLRQPRGRPDAASTSPTARSSACSSTTSRSTSATAQLVRHERVLDFREGVLTREVEWISPAGQGIRLRSTRLVSFVQRSMAAIRYEVEPIDAAARIVVQSELVANEPLPEGSEGPADGRRAGRRARARCTTANHGLRAGLVHRTRRSGLLMAAGMDHVVDGPEGTVTEGESEPDLARVTVTTELEAGQRLRLVKLLAYGWSSRRTLPSVRDQVEAALSSAKRTGWDGLRASQREYLDDVWDRADVELDGDAALQQAVRFSFFHVLQAAARAERRAIPAKGLTGRGYDGHSFWDMDTFTVPVLTYTVPDAAADALRWRHSTLDLAEARAHELRLQGAAFPWRTIRGQECSGYWPAGTAALHVNADIADAVRRYLAATEDEEFEAGPALDLLVATARLWRSIGHHDAARRLPDRRRDRAGRVHGAGRQQRLHEPHGRAEPAHGRRGRGPPPAARRRARTSTRRRSRAGATPRRRWSSRTTRSCASPRSPSRSRATATGRSTHARRTSTRCSCTIPYYLLYTSQVIKQADLVLALWLCGDHFDAEQKARDFDYYERITVRDSSLSACIQGIVAAEVGHLDLAYDYFAETVVHRPARPRAQHARRRAPRVAVRAAGWWPSPASAGCATTASRSSFAPRLPSRLTRLAFRLTYRGRRLRVEVNGRQARYELLQGEPLELLHHGEPFTLDGRRAAGAAVPPIPTARRRPSRRRASRPAVTRS